MRYSDIEPTISKRFRLPTSHPILTQIEIDPADWYRFERLAENTPEIRIITHDDPVNGWMTVYVGCIDHEVQDRLEKGWA